MDVPAHHTASSQAAEPLSVGALRVRSVREGSASEHFPPLTGADPTIPAPTRVLRRSARVGGSSAVTDGPAPASWPPPAAPPAPAPPVDPPPGGVLARITLVAAALAVFGYLVAGVLLAIPVSVPQVESCGTPAAYLLAGRVDTIPNDDDQIRNADGEVVTLDADVADAARAAPCQDRVADRATPAVVLIAAATLLGLLAFAVELVLVRPRQRAALAAGPPPPPT